MGNREKLYYTALEFLERDASPKDRADDEYACAESVSEVFKHAFGSYIGGRLILSTKEMYEALKRDSRIQKVSEPEFGDIIISPTGYGKYKNGHVGICGKWQIMSNNSRTGKWSTYFTNASWKEYYQINGGFPVFYFRVL